MGSYLPRTFAALVLAAACGPAEDTAEPLAPRGKPIAGPSPERTAAQSLPVAAHTDETPSERLQRGGFEALRMSAEERAALERTLAENGRSALPLAMFPERIRELDGARATIGGWMIPGRIEQRKVLDFMLVRDNQACCFGAMPTFDEWIQVDMEPGTSAEYLRYMRVEVTGVLTVGGVRGADGLEPPALRMRASKCEFAEER